MKLHPLAAALALLGAGSSYAQSVTTLPQVVVSATRFSEANPRVPANVTVITAEDIRTTPAVTVPDLLKSQAGVELRPLYGLLGIDATVDLRGFGDTATSNTLILLDGQRLNPADSSSINWSAIPVNSVERIEIIRGSGTVLYGDRASGGVINIITDKSGKPRASVSASAGSRGFRAADASVAGGAGKDLYFNLYGHYAESDGFRPNSQQDEAALGGRFGRVLSAGDVFVDYALYQNSNGLPGALFESQFKANPRQSRFLLNHQSSDGWRLRPGVAFDFSPQFTLETELGIGREDRAVRTTGFRQDTQRDNLSLTPRLRWRHGLGSISSETVGGLDVYRASVDADSVGFFGPNRRTADQTSSALYMQNVTQLTPRLHATLGLRRQAMDQEVSDRSAGLRGETTRYQNAYDAGLSYDVTRSLRVYGRAGRTFRFANTDELFGFNVNFEPVFAGDVRPQHGTIYEIGTGWRGDGLQLQASVYQLNLQDEIGYDADTGNNVNLPDTHRRGMELEGRWNLARALQVKLAYSYAQARFTEGALDGNWVPIVPRQKAALTLRWDAGRYGAYSALVNHVGDRYFSGDFANAVKKLSGYTTLDLQAEWALRPWTVIARVLNATDRKYAAFAGTSAFVGNFYYPADPRTFILSARYDFR